MPEGPYFDFSYEHLIESVDGSLRALQHRLHRHPAAAPPGRPRRARRGRPGLRRARGRRQGPRLRRLEPHAAADRPAQEVGDAADRRQPAAALDHARADHRPGRRRRTCWAWTSRSRSTAAASSTTAACTTSPIQAWSPFQAGFFNGRVPRLAGLSRAERRHRPPRGQVRRARRSRSPRPGSPGIPRTCRSSSAPPPPSASPLRPRAPTFR